MTRITTASLAFNSERNLNAAAARLASIQDKIGSHKEISRPSDNPVAAADIMAVRAEQRRNEQFARNAEDANGWLATTDTALATATNLMQKVRDLTVKGANDGALPATARDAIASELEQLAESLISAANAQYNGRHVFAGTSDAPAAVGENMEFSASAAVERRIGPATTIRIDSSGTAAFGEGPSSVFALIGAIAADLRTGTNVSARIAQVDAHLQNILATHSTVGARHAAVLSASESLLADSVSLEARRSSTEDIDLASAILNLKTQEVAYQAALSAAARTLQPSLMDFLR